MTLWIKCRSVCIMCNPVYLFQVVMQEGQAVEAGQEIADDLMDKLSVSKDQLLTGAYMDLILNGDKQ